MMTPPLNTADQPNGRDAAGRFAPGPGNTGRVRGSKNKLSRDALTAIQNLSGLAIMKLREAVSEGEFSAIKLVIELTVPRGGRTIELDTANPEAWADALAHGEISPMEAATAATALVKLNEAGEMIDLAKRITELESIIAEGGR